jgi:hypothetical protein
MMKNRNIKTHLSNGAHPCCDLSPYCRFCSCISVIAQEDRTGKLDRFALQRPGVHIVTKAPSPAEMAMQSNT